MVRTYRDPYVLGRRFPTHEFLGFAAFLFALPFLFFVLVGGRSPRPADFLPITEFAGLVLAFGYCGRRQWNNKVCREIRLSEDGTCELEMKRGVVRLHANQIQAVRFAPETDDHSEGYFIRYQGGTVRITKRMTDFADFLTRLKALNPAIDLTSFPAAPGQASANRQVPNAKGASPARCSPWS